MSVKELQAPCQPDGIAALLSGTACSTLLVGLDDAQRAGVVAGEGLTVIEAGAGTGKTRTLTTRIAALLRAGESPFGIVASTFTRDASIQMRQRALTLGVPGTGLVRICTLHALAAAVLRRHWAAAGLVSADFIIADPDEKREVVTEAVEASGLLGAMPVGDEAAWKQARKETVRQAMSFIDRWKENGLTVADILDPERERRSEAEEAMAAIYVAYQERLSARNLLDFGDLGLAAVRVLQTDAAALREEAGSIGWLMIDEWQDTNRLQLRFVALLSSLGANVTVVGDDDQSLYSWRGAIPRLMERTPEFLPEVASRGLHRVRLVTNRRCTDQILAPANMMVDYNPRAEPKELRSGRNGSPVTVAAHASDVAEAADTAKRLGKLIASGVEAREIAVLVRGKRVLDELGKVLVKNRIPHAMQAGTSFLERSEVLDVLAYLKLALDPGQDLAFQRIAARPTRGLGPAAVKEILSSSSARRIPIHEALSALADGGGLKGAAREGASRMARHLSTMADACRMDEPSEDIVRYVLDTVGYLEWARGKDAPETLDASARTLIEMARDQPRLVDLLTDVSVSGDAEQRADGAVHVGTLHGSKGLEWDHVFLVGFEDDIIPSPRSIEEAETASDSSDPWCVSGGGGLEEERRLAHVGLTRARMSVHVSFAGIRRVFGKPKPAKPSRLLHEAELEVPRVPRAGAADYGQRKAARGQAKRREHEFW